MNKILLILIGSISLFAFDIKTVVVAPHTFVMTLSGYGTIYPIKTAEIIAREAGIVSSLDKMPGQKVKKGDKLFTITLQPSQSKLLALRMQIRESDEKLAFAKKAFDRIKKLYQNRASFKKELLKVKNSYKEAKIENEALHREWNTLFEKFVYCAPANGVIRTENAINGDYVKAKSVVLELFDPGSVVAQLKIFDPKEELKVGMGVSIMTNSAKEQAKIISIAPELTRAGARKVYCKFIDKRKALHSNDYVKGVVNIAKSSSLGIPAFALFKSGGHFVVLLKTDKGYIKQRVDTGMRYKGFVQIKAGLKAGQKVVGEGAYELIHKNISKQMKILD